MRAISIALLVAVLSISPTLGQDLTVARIVDGDTFELSDGRSVRLIGIDTPEKHPSAKLDSDAERSGQDKATIQMLGELASRHAAELALGKPAISHRSVLPCQAWPFAAAIQPSFPHSLQRTPLDLRSWSPAHSPCRSGACCGWPQRTS